MKRPPCWTVSHFSGRTTRLPCRALCTTQRKLLAAPLRASNKPSNSTGKEDDIHASTLSSLDLFLSVEESSVDVVEDTVALEAEDKPEVAAPPPAPPSPSTARNWREDENGVLRPLLLATWDFANFWLREEIQKKVKPTSIVEKDEALPRAEPTFAYLMLLTNIMVYAIGLTRIAQGPEGTMDYFLSLAEVNELVEAGEYYRVVTANFIHDSFLHLMVSSYALLTIAPEAEAVLGSFTFLSTYVLGGVAGTAVCFLLTDTVTVGPSSGIFALIGAMGAFLYKNHKAPKTSNGLFYTAGLLAFNLFVGEDRRSAVDNLGHMGGLLCGIYLGILLSPVLVNGALRSTSQSGSNGLGGGQGSSAMQPPIDTTATPASSLESPPQVSPANGVPTPSSAEPLPGPPGVRVLQPNPLQALVAVSCVGITIGCSVALMVIYRTGHLPPPKWPF